MRYMLVVLLSVLCFSSTGVYGKEGKEEFGFIRMFTAAAKQPRWQRARNARGKMLVLLKACAAQEAVSSPASDRYMVTCYGGTIDLVRFFKLAAAMCKGDEDISKRLYREWLSEGGKQHRLEINTNFPPQAHPDDLPSNALGALWGQEVRSQMNQYGFNLFESFCDFVEPMVPVPDSIAKEFSYNRIVAGFSEQAPTSFRLQRSAWLTAAPLVQTKLLNEVAIEKTGRPICRDVEEGEDALKKAGFLLLNYDSAPILIVRSNRTSR